METKQPAQVDGRTNRQAASSAGAKNKHHKQGSNSMVIRTQAKPRKVSSNRVRAYELEITTHFAALVKARRETLEISQKDFAQCCDVTMRTIRRIESGKKTFNISTLNKIAVRGFNEKLKKLLP